MVHGTWYMVNDKMTIKQLSIFIENKGGTLIKVLDLLSKAGIQIIASTVADTKDYGIYRVLTNNPAQAYLILKDAGINVQLSEVFALSIDDQPGRAAETILYLYSFLWKGKGVLVFRADQSEKAKESIMLNKLTFLTEEDFRA